MSSVEALDTVMNDDDAQEYGEFKSPHHNGGNASPNQWYALKIWDMANNKDFIYISPPWAIGSGEPVSYTHLRAHET